jgi:hypothetical protein
VKEELLPGGKDKVITAIRTLQYLVDEVHYASPRACLGIFQYSVDQAPDWHRLTSRLLRLQFDRLSSHSPNPGMRGEMVPNLYEFLKSAGLPVYRISGLTTLDRHLQG